MFLLLWYKWLPLKVIGFRKHPLGDDNVHVFPVNPNFVRNEDIVLFGGYRASSTWKQVEWVVWLSKHGHFLDENMGNHV